MTVFSVQDVLIKYLSESTSVFQIFFVRSIIGLLLISLYLSITKQKIIFKSQYPILTLIRVMLFFSAFLAFYVSLSGLSLAVANTLFFTSPFFITIFSMIFLKEKIGIRRWFAIIFGFIGVIIVMNPKIDDFNFFYILPVYCALCYALSMIIIKITSDKDSVYSQIFHLYISALILSSLISLFIGDGSYNNFENTALQFLFREWQLSYNINTLILLFIGLAGGIGFFCLHQAYRIASPPTIAPFEYIIIIWSLIFGWLIFEDTVNLRNIIGIFIIVGSGLYVFFRENVRKSHISIDEPLR
tara:strand:+ start:81 stop:980 length:900 start_codon:yes stop_codon:yes gene_type:complete